MSIITKLTFSVFIIIFTSIGQMGSLHRTTTHSANWWSIIRHWQQEPEQGQACFTEFQEQDFSLILCLVVVSDRVELGHIRDTSLALVTMDKLVALATVTLVTKESVIPLEIHIVARTTATG
jgi:type III secretory pathway component EscT